LVLPYVGGDKGSGRIRTYRDFLVHDGDRHSDPDSATGHCAYVHGRLGFPETLVLNIYFVIAGIYVVKMKGA
jgi:hypothetical protein